LFYLATRVTRFVGKTHWMGWKEPFVFSEGCCPNITDPNTYEKIENETELLESVDNMVAYTIANHSQWEEVVLFDISRQKAV